MILWTLCGHSRGPGHWIASNAMNTPGNWCSGGREVTGQSIRWCNHHNAEIMDNLNTDAPTCWDAESVYRCEPVGAFAAIEDIPSTITSADWFNRDDNI